MNAAQLAYNLAIAGAFMAIGLVFVVSANGIQRLAVRHSDWLRHVPVLRFFDRVGGEWVRSNQYVLFVRLAGGLLVALSILLTYVLFTA